MKVTKKQINKDITVYRYNYFPIIYFFSYQHNGILFQTDELGNCWKTENDNFTLDCANICTKKEFINFIYHEFNKELK